jgi:hypothetical protein
MMKLLKFAEVVDADDFAEPSMTTTTLLSLPSGDDLVTVGSVAKGVYSRQISMSGITGDNGNLVEMTIPGVRIILTPAAADKLRLWFNQWVKETAGEWWE